MTDLNDLDREVAEVLGMEVLASVIMKGKTITRHWKHNGIRFHPSTNPTQAVELLDGKAYKILSYGSDIVCNIIDSKDSQTISSMIGETIPIAICRAVVAAKNIG